MKALLIVDVQNDFCPGGALAVPQGDEVVPVINAIMESFTVIVASKDWHPEKTVHFDKWPVHCVQNTPGAEFRPDLDASKIQQVFLKGTGDKDDGYSAYEATNLDLVTHLREKQVTNVYLVGLATDYCVKASALDSLRCGFNTYVVTDAIRAVNLEAEDGAKALAEMGDQGAHQISSAQIQL